MDTPENKINAVFIKTARTPVVATYAPAVRWVDSRRPSLGSDQEAGSFATVNANARVRVGRNMTVTVGVENMADKDYEEQALSPRPGRTVRAGLEYKL